MLPCVSIGSESEGQMLIQAIIGHLVGDFLTQNDWQSANKKKSSFVCGVHCLLWTLSVCAFSWWHHPLAIIWLFGTHFAIDRTTFIHRFMTWNGQKSFATGVLSPWSIVVVDQVFHLLTLWVVDAAYLMEVIQ
jgi:Protein of unknown function (DUF3307)